MGGGRGGGGGGGGDNGAFAPPSSSAAARGRVVSLAELKAHSAPGNCWLAIEGKVYDVSQWADHPGGRVLYSAAGADATDTFRAFHNVVGAQAQRRLELSLQRFEIGSLAAEAAAKVAPSAFEEDYRKLYEVVRNSPEYAKANFFYYAWKLVSTLAILGVAAFVTMQPGAGFWQKMAGALLVSLFWQQCGWLAHDFAHHQVFADRRWNDAGVLFVGNFLQAFSLEWWKNKHNTHHAIPNLHESQAEAHDGDPDIDTLPFLAWSQRFVEKTKAGGAAASPTARFFVRNQALLYFPVLFFARITWALSSIAYAFSLDVSLFGSEAEIVKGVQAKLAAAKATGGAAPVDAGGSAAPAAAIAAGSAGALRYPFWERVLLAGHYAWYLYLAFGPHNSLPAALAFFFVSQTFAGLLLAVAFGVGHNGMTVYDADARPGFAELQITTTRNVHDSWGNGWFMGGLHFQVEHHLFPFVPRHNLYKLRPVVEAMCKKHGVRYHATGLWQGNAEVLGSLDRIAQGLREFPGI